MIVLQLSITRRHFEGFYSAFCPSFISCASSEPRGEDFGQIFATQLNFLDHYFVFCIFFSFSVSGFYVTAPFGKIAIIFLKADKAVYEWFQIYEALRDFFKSRNFNAKSPYFVNEISSRWIYVKNGGHICTFFIQSLIDIS